MGLAKRRIGAGVLSRHSLYLAVGGIRYDDQWRRCDRGVRLCPDPAKTGSPTLRQDSSPTLAIRDHLVRTMRLILSRVKFWPLIESSGGVFVKSTESTFAVTSVEIPTDCLLASTAVAVMV